MAAHEQNMLQVQPQALALLRGAFGAAIAQVSATLTELKRRAYLPGPWLGDEVSAEVAAHYTRRAMDDPDSSYRALLSYRDELTRIHDTLQRMEEAYRRGEDAEALRWQPRA